MHQCAGLGVAVVAPRASHTGSVRVVCHLEHSIPGPGACAGPPLPDLKEHRREMDEHMAFATEQAREIGERIGIDWDHSQFDVEQFRMGLGVELEHGLRDPKTNVTDDDPTITGKIAWAHLNEFPDYYTRLEKMEGDAERYWAERGQ